MRVSPWRVRLIDRVGVARLPAMFVHRAAGLAALTMTTLLVATPSAWAAPAALPKPDHVLIVFMENKDTDEVIGSSSAPWLNSLAHSGANFTNAHAETHPSQPNYIAMFSGSTQGVTDDGCDHSFDAPNLGSELIAAGKTFVGYAEQLPHAGSTTCSQGRYARKHSPWVNFTDLPPATTNLPASALGTDWDRLPTVAFLTPDMCNDMHDCPVAAGDAWARKTLGSYMAWAQTHNSMLVMTFDESETKTPGNPIPTIFAGPMVKAGDVSTRVDHYSMLRTLEDMYGLKALGKSADAEAITGIWRTPAAAPKAPATPRPTQAKPAEPAPTAPAAQAPAAPPPAAPPQAAPSHRSLCPRACGRAGGTKPLRRRQSHPRRSAPATAAPAAPPAAAAPVPQAARHRRPRPPAPAHGSTGSGSGTSTGGCGRGTGGAAPAAPAAAAAPAAVAAAPVGAALAPPAPAAAPAAAAVAAAPGAPAAVAAPAAGGVAPPAPTARTVSEVEAAPAAGRPVVASAADQQRATFLGGVLINTGAATRPSSGPPN